jgi:hypothetical protein
MNKPFQTKLILLSLLACSGVPAIAEDAAEPAASAPSSTVVKVEKAIQHGAEAATRGVKKGVTAGVQGVERGAHAVAGGVERGAHAAARGIEHGAAATARVTKKVIRKVDGAVSPAPAAAASN